MELRNQVIKKDIEIKEKAQILKDMIKEIQGLKKDKENFAKIKCRFET